jgi:hypothetical protein
MNTRCASRYPSEVRPNRGARRLRFGGAVAVQARIAPVAAPSGHALDRAEAVDDRREIGFDDCGVRVMSGREFAHDRRRKQGEKLDGASLT